MNPGGPIFMALAVAIALPIAQVQSRGRQVVCFWSAFFLAGTSLLLLGLEMLALLVWVSGTILGTTALFFSALTGRLQRNAHDPARARSRVRWPALVAAGIGVALLIGPALYAIANHGGPAPGAVAAESLRLGALLLGDHLAAVWVAVLSNLFLVAAASVAGRKERYEDS